MDVNKFEILQTGLVDKEIVLPVQLNWDYIGLDDAIDAYEEDMINQVIGVGRDFEVSRFAHEPATGTTNDTFINYEFYFYSGGPLNQISNWKIDYLNQGFTSQEVFYYVNSFSNSFFKLDLYDSVDEKKQINYITIIIPTQQGTKMDVVMNRTPVQINKPKFVLDYVGDSEGFFIYWLKKRNFLDIKRFYMTAKFFDAKTGQFIKMMTGSTNRQVDRTNGPQAYLTNPFSFDSTKYFYYQVDLDYEKQTYVVSNTTGQRLGTNIPIKWFEYVNP